MSRRKREDGHSKRASRVLLTLTEGAENPNAQKRLTVRLSKAPAAGRRSVLVAPSAPEKDREVFLDDEEWEFAPLVIVDDNGMMDDDEWEDFDGPMSAAQPVSASSVYSHPSDFEPQYTLPNPHDLLSPNQVTPPDSGRHLASDGSIKTTSSLPLLAIPARSQRKAAHLRKPSYFTDMDAFQIPVSPQSPARSQRATLQVPRGPARRRPAPLSIPSPAKSSRYSGVSPLDVRLVRKAFIAQSFTPRPAGADVGAVPNRPPTPPSEDEKPRGRLDKRSPKMSLGNGMKNVLSAVSITIRTGSGSRSSSGRRGWI
jgi:hypothetical protein